MKNTKLTSKGLALLTTVVLGINGYAVANAETINRGDSIVTTAVVNIRSGPSVDTIKLGEVPKGQVCDRLLTIDGFDLIRYNGKIIFVSGDFTDSNVYDYNNEYYSIEEDSDLIRTTTEVYFRLGPSTNEQKIYLLGKDEELIVLGKSTSYTDPNDVWYLAKHEDKIGFVKAQYVESLKSKIQKLNPNIEDIEVKMIGSLTTDTYLRDEFGNKMNKIETYQTVKVMGTRDDNYVVSYNGKVGLLPKSNVNTFLGIFVVVDRSDQKIFLYKDADCAFESYCTTGWDRRVTDLGLFTIYEKGNHRTFSEDHQARYLWANFDNGNGIHDAPWEEEQNFGSNKYRKHQGSNGCVRVPDFTAKILTKYLRKGQKVLVKK